MAGWALILRRWIKPVRIRLTRNFRFAPDSGGADATGTVGPPTDVPSPVLSGRCRPRLYCLTPAGNLPLLIEVRECAWLKQSRHRRFATMLMVVATLAFVLQGYIRCHLGSCHRFSHYYLSFVFHHGTTEHRNHIIVHSHADGLTHAHAIDEDDDAVAKHIKQPGWQMALVVRGSPPGISAHSVATSQRMT